MRPHLCNNSQINYHLRHGTGSDLEIFQNGGGGFQGFFKKKKKKRGGSSLIFADLHMIF